MHQNRSPHHELHLKNPTSRLRNLPKCPTAGFGGIRVGLMNPKHSHFNNDEVQRDQRYCRPFPTSNSTTKCQNSMLEMNMQAQMIHRGEKPSNFITNEPQINTRQDLTHEYKLVKREISPGIQGSARGSQLSLWIILRCSDATCKTIFVFLEPQGCLICDFGV